MQKKNSFSFCHIFLLLCLVSFKLSYSQQDIWIDKDENEDYEARHECSFVQAGDAFYMFGGREKAQQLDVYDFKNDKWSIGGSAPKEFNHFQATFYEGFIWVIGSFKTNKFPREEPADFIWLYYPPTKTWIQGPEIPKDRRRGGAGLVIYDNKFYLVGGNTIGHDGGYVNWLDEYDPKSNTWTALSDAPNARDHFSALTVNDKLYALGGRHSGGDGGVFGPLIAQVDVYDFKSKKWSILSEPLPTPRAAPGVALFHNELFVMGGEGEQRGPAYKRVEAYNLETDTWSRKADMHYARHGTQAIVSGEGIYIAGGSPKRGGGRQLNMEVYNEDAPRGLPLIPSKLKGPKKICIKKGEMEIVKVKNTNGNTGNFINSIKTEGKNGDQFKILENFDLSLLGSKEIAYLKIIHLRENQNDTAQIVITYNGNSKLIIKVVSK
ncbi:ring canal kelch [Hyunsoonleella sp. SJ7]|uniref:Ring canal kelch n=1 Tax=Hyunsoonleella aquatilis TaxID=2762758 RepID=A0A923KI51_9FLAO|nr:kelch repeat-containing protein [Hyunsoonleella aquatilis]MBC3757914.1 ring canal kelch [Hyunsoonleella aquatilis]